MEPVAKKRRGRPLGTGQTHRPIPNLPSVLPPMEVDIALQEVPDPLTHISLHGNLLDAPMFATTTPGNDVIPTTIAPDMLTDQFGSAGEIISWLFSDSMLANVRDPLFSPYEYGFDSPMAIKNMLTPPIFGEKAGIGEIKQSQMLDLLPGIKGALATNGIAEDTPFQKRYISSYWATFHAQFPILHKPTFCADKCPSGLLWMIIAVGAALLKEPLLAKCIASPLRWAIFQSQDFNPPAKLWVIQALLLMEIYEKALSDRQMHVRAHIHHGTTLQLIRRGTILTGVTNEFPRSTGSMGDGDDYLAADSSDPWKRWIQSEATKRAALMAFVVDAYHNSTFGHSSLISVHEIRLSLPCSQSLWDSTHSDNDQSYDYRKIPPSTMPPLIEALKLTLNKKRVETSPFGRKVMLSGLMSISNQMQQRDFQLDSLGWLNNGSPVSHSAWKDHLRSSFDFLASDYNDMLQIPGYFDYYAHPSASSTHRKELLSPYDPHRTGGTEESLLNRLLVAGCADPFFHLAHINLQVSMLDLHVYAGAPVMFSQSFRASDFERSARSNKAWATSPQGIDAVRHAIIFLEEMLCPTAKTDLCANPFSSQDVVPGGYKAENDPLVHRPHIVFVCTLVVWSYNFALQGPESDILGIVDGPLEPAPDEKVTRPSLIGSTSSEMAAIADAALARMEHIRPNKPALEYIKELSSTLANENPAPSALVGFNQTTGLLRLIIQALKVCSWTLIEEDARLLVHCLERSLGKQTTRCYYHF